MPTLPYLVAEIEKLDDRDRSSLDHLGRILREAPRPDGVPPFIPTTKRGSGASHLDVPAAVNYALGWAGADSLKDAPMAVDRFRSLKKHYHVPAEPPLEAFKKIAEAEDFGAAFEMLVDGVPEIYASTFQFIADGFKDFPQIAKHHHENMFAALFPVAVEVVLHRYSATIRMKVLVGNQTGPVEQDWRTEFEIHFLQDMALMEKGFYGRGSHRKVSVTIDMKVLIALWRSVYADKHPNLSDTMSPVSA